MADSNPTSSQNNSSTNSSSTTDKAPKKPSEPPISSLIKAYWIPATLFILFFVFQIFFLPSAFPPSHYEVLGISRLSSIEEVKEAYDNLASNWKSGAKPPTTNDFIKIRYAYELLTDPLWKRDYDLFSIDEHQHVLENILQLNSNKVYSSVNLPLLVGSTDSHDIDFESITSGDIQSIVGERPWLMQVYSNGSNLCKQFSSKWKKIATLLGEIADTGVVELGEIKLASQLAEKKTTGQLFFRNGLPSLIAFPQGCKSSSCLIRYEGDLSVDAVTDWFAVMILKLPRIPYYTKDTLGPRFLAKSSYNKVKVMFFSDTGMRATPFIRQTARNYQDYASFACVLWREEEFSYWSSIYDVESAPATVFLRDPGTKPLVLYGAVNSSWFVDVMEDNRLHELPQLRTMTSVELGCDSRGYSRAGTSTTIWYCVVVIGRPSPEMNEMREVLRRAQQTLSEKSYQDVAPHSNELAAHAAIALKDKRLTLTWMDGEVQKNLCMFYIGGELSLECCGPRRGIEDAPQVVMVRYMRNDSVEDPKDKRSPSSLLDSLKDDVDPVSQLVARYNGSAEPLQIIEWISKNIKDGDSAKLPFYRTNTPELVPENSDPLWFVSGEKFLSTRNGMKHKLWRVIAWCRDLSGDPRIGPLLLLGALLSFGGIWLHRSQPTPSSDSSQWQQAHTKKKIPKEWRNRRRNSVTGEIPPSITDVEPKDAYQMEFSDSDSEENHNN
ncbi:dnaJ homolog subfamily C member 16-like [Chenopodium quinoa]|uniref:dnaJ homolog subfamily C member 16-like n=1 Tax=Chenopodium quinoa TaxID=63459 RepID=UPI000B78C0F3|nr:dnaJ homolog subfamily C member 16-like [Chenopodium quinoa]